MYKLKCNVIPPSSNIPRSVTIYTLYIHFWSIPTYCIIHTQTKLLLLLLLQVQCVCGKFGGGGCAVKMSFVAWTSFLLIENLVNEREVFSPFAANLPQIGWQWKLGNAKPPHPTPCWFFVRDSVFRPHRRRYIAIRNIYRVFRLFENKNSGTWDVNNLCGDNFQRTCIIYNAIYDSRFPVILKKTQS